MPDASETLPASAAPAAGPVMAGTVTLDVPIKRGSQTVTQVQVRLPKSGELRGVSLVALLQMDVGALQTVLPRITTPMLTKADVDNLDPADLVQLGTEVSNFLLPKADRVPASPTA